MGTLDPQGQEQPRPCKARETLRGCVLHEDLAFDAQQAAEKCLKALLLFQGVNAPRTHSIGYLLNIIESNCNIQIPQKVREAVVLSDYAVTTRYPGDYEDVSEEEYLLAVELADAVWTWVTSVIQYY